MCTDLPWGAQRQGNVNRMKQAHHYFLKKSELIQGQKLDKSTKLLATRTVILLCLLLLTTLTSNSVLSVLLMLFFWLCMQGVWLVRSLIAKHLIEINGIEKGISKCKTVSTEAMTTLFQIRDRCSVEPP